jgi:hypothetical protein
MKRWIPPKPEWVGERVDDILRELGEAVTRAEVMGMVKRMTFGMLRWSRKMRKAEADHARRIDDHFAEIEPLLADPDAPRFNRFIYSALAWVTGLIREACQRQMQFRPKGGRDIDSLKRECANCALYLTEKAGRPVSGSAWTTFPTVTALLFEAVTGERNASVKRACEDVLRKRRRLLKIGPKVISKK